MAIFGGKLFVWRGGAVIASAKSCQIGKNCDIKEISSPRHGKAREHIAGRTDWRITVDGLLPDEEAISMLDEVGQTFYLTVGFQNGSKKHGIAIMTSCEERGAVKDLATYSCVFVGSGELE